MLDGRARSLSGRIESIWETPSKERARVVHSGEFQLSLRTTRTFAGLGVSAGNGGESASGLCVCVVFCGEWRRVSFRVVCVLSSAGNGGESASRGAKGNGGFGVGCCCCLLSFFGGAQ